MFVYFGTRFGKKHNLSSEDGQCRLCGAFSNLKSYEANKYFHLYWIPLIPLGKKRVDSHCSKCDQQLETPYKDWLAMGEKVIERAKTNFESNLNDINIALEYYEAIKAYGNQMDAEKFKDFLYDKFKGDETLKSYFRGTIPIVESSGNKVETLEKRVKEDPDDENAKYALGWSYARKNQFEDAYKTLVTIQNPVRGLIEFNGLLTISRNIDVNDSYELLKLMGAKYPQYGQKHNAYNKLIKEREIELNIPENKSIISKEYKTYQRNQKLIPAIIVAAFLVIGISVSGYKYTHQKVHVLNGSSEPISIEIGDVKNTIAPNSSTVIETIAGQHQAIVETNYNSRLIDFEISSNFFDILSGNKIYVLNPNGSAIIGWEEVVYSFNPNLDPGHYEFHVGEEFRIYKNIDYPFVDPPEEIQLDSYKSKEVRICLSFVEADPMMGSMLLMIYPDGHSSESELSYMESQMQSNYQDEEYIDLYDSLSVAYGEKERATKFLHDLKKK